MIRFLFIGDIFGEPGRQAVKKCVPALKEKFKLDLVIANGENAAHGRGISVKIADELLGRQIDILTSGNHIWHAKNIFPILDQKDTRVLRPHNYSPRSPGRGSAIVVTQSGLRVGVMNLIGQLFMDPLIDSPFRAADELIGELTPQSDILVLDMHAEATSEKRAMGWHVDGRVQACLGTHTHVPTADEEILPQGCAYITDVGMTGPYDSVIGLKKDKALERFLTGMPSDFDVASSDVRLCGVAVEVDEKQKRAVSIQRVCERV